MEHEFLVNAVFTDDDGVAGVMAALIACDAVVVARQDIDDFAFSFVAPLGAYDDDIGHNYLVEEGEIVEKEKK